MSLVKIISPVNDHDVIAMNEREGERFDLVTLRNEGKKVDAVNSGASEDLIIEDFYDKMFQDDAVPITADDDKSDDVYASFSPQKSSTLSSNELKTSQLSDGSVMQIGADSKETRNTVEKSCLENVNDFLTRLLQNNSRLSGCVVLMVTLVLVVVIYLNIALAPTASQNVTNYKNNRLDN